MEINHIPKTFWHAASFSLIVFTLGFLFISYQSGELTVKFNNLEIKTQDARELQQILKRQEKSLDNQRQTIAEREEEVADLERLLGARMEEIEGLRSQLASLSRTSNGSAAARELRVNISRVANNPDYIKQLSQAKNQLDILQSKQNFQMQNFQLQKKLFDQKNAKVMKGKLGGG